MKIVSIIPARHESSRFPAKLMQLLGGKTVILRTYENVLSTGLFDQVIVATDSKVIYDEIFSNGGKVVMTKTSHQCGSDRIAEAVIGIDTDVVVNVQGDEPFVDPKDIDKVIDFHKKKPVFDIVVPSMLAEHNVLSRNLVKVVFSDNGKILYFSRALVPFDYNDVKNLYYRDLSIVSFKYDALKKYNNFKQGKIEKIEGIELIRAIENNLNLGTFKATNSGFAVDVNQDLMKAIDLMPTDKIRKLY